MMHLKWTGQWTHPISDNWVMEQIFKQELSGKRSQGRPRIRLMNICIEQGFQAWQTADITEDKSQWRQERCHWRLKPALWWLSQPSRQAQRIQPTCISTLKLSWITMHSSYALQCLLSLTGWRLAVTGIQPLDWAWVSV